MRARPLKLSVMLHQVLQLFDFTKNVVLLISGTCIPVSKESTKQSLNWSSSCLGSL